ncbi:pilus assembly protein TadG [Pseudomonas taiwanensis]|uniref:TadE family protein n=1 Tax=Pseudomonas taiwanensis TaxID=470150 RepID=UPI0015BB98FE|nr:TadE/TadG family type IV pilus assembly protein [Pseudomonas taiwanensis]NWL75553.1 pilus assembly protein TadG [Pseudomonas taiwanensis]
MGRRQFKGSGVQRGVAMVEFAITLPLLLLLLLVIGEFGRMLYQYNSLLQAGRDAGRYIASKAWNRTLGTIDLTSDPQLLIRTKNIARYGVPVAQYGKAVVPGAADMTVDVTVVPGTTDHVQVSISYTFQPVIGEAIPALFGSAIPLGIGLRSTVVMRAL